ncbi:flagellar basal body L-ring protein FlgH [Piscinibacter sakaiensis]|uniref:Flagellar L-ring protein n=1 Tax=Piscinibacter sakaiensis TaxID=1547922 RepID=A0A0K8NTL9_PISS1|nr:flagellar basal body L-ring protein FlgH [Piscinibacter sakaiensis]GAP33756.1 flagellar L-ring protein FlgH [Piscinibacter sakaiensis]
MIIFVLRPGVVAAIAVTLALAGCESFSNAVSPRAKVDLAPQMYARPDPQPAPAPVASGSIFQSAQYRPLFEDHRARLVGDALTVQIVEKVSATQSSTSTVDKNGKVSGSVSALPFLAPNSFNRASAAGQSANTFEGKGSTQSSNDFSGTITAIVTEVLPNGHLMIAGEKQVGVNHNVDVLRFTGQVDPRSIQPGNTVASAAIANVRIENRGRGQAADAQGIGWLARFFLSVMPI